MSKRYSTKLPNEMAASFNQYLESTNQRPYSFFQEAAERAVTTMIKPPPVPQKTQRVPPVPTKRPMPTTFTGACRELRRLIAAGESETTRFNQVADYLMTLDVDLPCWDDATRHELRKVSGELVDQKWLDATGYQSGVLRAADEDSRLTLPNSNESCTDDLDDPDGD